MPTRSAISLRRSSGPLLRRLCAGGGRPLAASYRLLLTGC
jgi:hypothetical protein